MSFTASFLSLIVGLALVAFVAGVGARVAVAFTQRRRLRAEAAGQAQRGWGGKDHERVRNKYFEKERRARAVRARHRHARPAAEPPPAPEPPGPVNLDRLHRATLGLTGEVTPDAVRKAYKARVREYHPDQVARLGIKLRRLAEDETKRINEAYTYFRKRLGF